MSGPDLNFTPEPVSAATRAAFAPYPWCLHVLDNSVNNAAYTPVQTIHQVPTADNPWGLSVLLHGPEAVQAFQSLLYYRQTSSSGHPDAATVTTTQAEIHTLYAFGAGVSGYKGLLHGGLAATVLGQQGYALAAADPTMAGAVTIKCDVSYLGPVPIPGAVRVRAWKVWTEGRRVGLKTVLEDERGTVLVQAQMVYVIPRGKL